MKWIIISLAIVTLFSSSNGSSGSGDSIDDGRQDSIENQLNMLKKGMTELNRKFEKFLEIQNTTYKRLDELTEKISKFVAPTEKPKPKNYTIPTGCVKIRSYLGEKYLNASDYDDRRRLLTVEPTGDEFTLYKVYDFYQILRGKEYMYVGHQANEKRRHVFTRKTGIVEDDGHWTITKAPGFDGMVHIQCRRYHENLFVADTDNVVNTWVRDEYNPTPEDEPGMDPKYVWELIQC